MKHWTQREVRTGGTVSPASVQAEMTSSQGSIATLDRSQLPAACIDASRLKQHALHRVYEASPWTTTGEQTAVVDDGTPLNNWKAFTYQTYNTGWTTVATATLDGFKGGNLFVEWSGNAYVFGAFAATVNMPMPRLPRYLGLRILVNSVLLVEHRGPAYHESFRIFGADQFPPGDLTLRLQLKVTSVGPDDPLTSNGVPEDVPQAHAYSNKYLAIGRFR